MSISAVINTRNEEKNIKKCLDSVRQLADEIVLVDMESKDKTVAMAKKYGAKVFSHPYTCYVEPARNFALRCAQGKHILVLDADEEIPVTLAKKLKKIAQENEIDFVRIPRKNIIFGKWVKYSRWWPDVIVRFFKKGAVTWSDKIHSVPLTKGEGKDLEIKEANAIVHYHYQSVSQYLERINRYTDIQLQELVDSQYRFKWQDLIKKPTSEFLSRFFAGEGYKDGVHGLVLALLQTFSEFILYLKVWEKQGFQEKAIEDFDEEIKKLSKDFKYWQKQKKAQELGFLGKILSKLKLLKL